MSLSGTAAETLAIVEQGTYLAPSGRRVTIADAVARAKQGTELHRPDELRALAARVDARAAGASASARLEVTDETTADAGRRLVQSEGERHVLALNFASAKNPGGGFLGGAKAQEEDLARCSALYACQLTQRGYYDANRAHGSLLYTDHMIYSPDVPFFRDDRLDLLEEPFLLSVLTAPAPNAGEHLRRHAGDSAGVNDALASRARLLLALAAEKGHRTLVLGAWGCGVFRNDPAVVADTFATLLATPALAGAFDRVVFGVYDRSKERRTLGAFRARFG